MTEQKPTGRPSTYTQEIADEICAGLAEGKSLRTVCSAEHLPCVATVFNWFRTKEGFLEQYTRAKEESADALTDEMLDIADDGSNDWMANNSDEEGKLNYQINGEHIQRSRLRIETRKWLSSKLKPKKYGDKITTEHTGVVGLIPIEEGTDPAKAAALYQQMIQNS